MQDLNVSWNKPFRALAMEKYDKWPAEEGITQETPAGYLKPLPRRVIVNQIMQEWKEITSDVMKKSFKTCKLNLQTAGSEDDTIHCFTKDEPCKSGKNTCIPVAHTR